MFCLNFVWMGNFGVRLNIILEILLLMQALKKKKYFMKMKKTIKLFQNSTSESSDVTISISFSIGTA